MMWLVGHLLGPLVLAALFAGVIGWCWHLWRTAPQAQARQQERARLLDALIQKVREHRPGRAAEQDAQEARAVFAASSERQALRVAELERRLEAAQRAAAQREELEDQVLSLRGQLARRERAQEELAAERARAEDLEQRWREAQTRAAMLAEQQPAAASDAESAEEAARRAWRLRYFAARVRHLEAGAGETQPQAVQRAAWRMRYFEARARSLEEALAARAASAAAPSEEAGVLERQAWRLRYLDSRLNWIIERSRAAVGAADGEIEELKQALAGAEAALRAEQALARPTVDQQSSASEAERAQAHAGDLQRLRWRADYLGRRVEHLEARLAEVGAPAPLAAPVATEAAVQRPSRTPPAPEPAVAPAAAAASAPAERAPAPAQASARPPRLASPRNGAPDDLRLIQGVTPQIESKLHASGVYHFDQIAGWGAAEAAWMDSYLALRGQIGRDGWVWQCKKLAQGERATAVEPA